MQLKRNLYYARRDHVQWPRVKVDDFGSKIPTEQSSGVKLVGKKAQKWTVNYWSKNGRIEKPLAPRDFLPQKPPRYEFSAVFLNEIILTKIIYHH